MSRVWVYARSSGDEADTGQDVRAQADSVRVRIEKVGHEVVGVSLDDGVSGMVAWAERPGLLEAINACRPRRSDGSFCKPAEPGARRTADALVVREVSRLSRQDPAEALTVWNQAAAEGVLFVSLKEGHFTTLGAEFDLEDETLTLIRFVTFWQAWKERRDLVAKTQSAMDDIKAGRRVTKSSKPVGRPKKGLSEGELAFARRSLAEKVSPAQIALALSKQRGAHDVTDPKVKRDRTVSRATVRRALGLENRSVDRAGALA